MQPHLIQVHTTPGFRQFGHRFAKPTTLVEVNRVGELTADSKAEVAINHKQFARLRWLSGTPKAPISYSDPDEAAIKLGQVEAELIQAREHMVALERERNAMAQELERGLAERHALQLEREAVARELAEMRSELEERQRAAAQLEEQIATLRTVLEEMQSKANTPPGKPHQKK